MTNRIRAWQLDGSSRRLDFPGLSMTCNIIGLHSIAKDVLIGTHAALSFGTSASIFSGMIASTRTMKGRGPETNVGTRERTGRRFRMQMAPQTNLSADLMKCEGSGTG